MDVWRRSPGTDPRRTRDEGRVVNGSSALFSQSTRDTPSWAICPGRGVAFSGEVKWLDVGTSGFSAIAADTHNGVIGIAAVHYRTRPGSTGTTSESSSARPCATAAGGVSTAHIDLTRSKRRSTTSIR